MESCDDAEVLHAKRRTSGEQQGSAPKGMARLVDEGESLSRTRGAGGGACVARRDQPAG